MSKADITTVRTTVLFPRVSRRGSGELVFRTNPLNYCVFGLKSRLCRSSVEPNYN